MSFKDVAGKAPLQKGLYRVEIPLFGVEKLPLRSLATSSRSWGAVISTLEHAPILGSKFAFKFPRTSTLNPSTGLDQPGGAYLVRKGYDSARGSFWCLMAVTSVKPGALTQDLYERVLRRIPGVLPLALGNDSARLRSLGKSVGYQQFVSSGAVAPGYQTPSTPAPSTGVKPIPAPAPSPTPAPRPAGTTSAPKPAPAKTVTQAAKTATTKVVQATKTATAKTVQTTKAATTKAVKTASTNPVAVVAACVAGVLLLKYLQAGRGT